MAGRHQRSPDTPPTDWAPRDPTAPLPLPPGPGPDDPLDARWWRALQAVIVAALLVVLLVALARDHSRAPSPAPGPTPVSAAAPATTPSVACPPGYRPYFTATGGGVCISPSPVPSPSSSPTTRRTSP